MSYYKLKCEKNYRLLLIISTCTCTFRCTHAQYV